MKKFGQVSRCAAAVTLALASWCVQAADEAASAPKEGARAEVMAPLKEADTLRQQGKYDEALAKLKQAEAVPNLSPYEAFFIWRVRAAVGLGAKNNAVAIEGLTHALTYDRFTPQEKEHALLALEDLYYQEKDYPHTIEYAKAYAQAGGTDPVAQQELTNALYLSGDYAAASVQLGARVKAELDANKVPSEQLLRMLASAQSKTQDDKGYDSSLELLARYYPKPEIWADLISRVQSEPTFAEHLRLDAYRLRLATGLLKKPEQYMEMAQLALQQGFPEEAQKVIEEGYSRGLLGTGPQAKQHEQLRAQAKRLATADASALAQTSGTASRDANASAGLGFALATAGQAERGVPLLEQAITKGGLKHPDATRLHLGIAQAMAGQKDAALKTLQSVQGKDGSAGLAHLWALYLQSPASNNAAAPAKS